MSIVQSRTRFRIRKQHLKHLLKSEHNQRYTASVSEQIASAVDAQTIAQRSPSFNGFLKRS